MRPICLDMTTYPAREDSDSSCRQLSIGGVSLQIVAKDGSRVAFDAEHERFSVDKRHPDINIDVEWIEHISGSSGYARFDSGTTWRLYERGETFCFDFGYPLGDRDPSRRLLVDRAFQRATLQVSSDVFSQFPGDVPLLAYPLDELLIMHRLTQEKAIELHGSGIVRPNGVGNLFVGHSGAGKSTTTRLWTSREEVEVLSDDRIIVRRDEGSVVKTPCEAGGSDSKRGALRLSALSASGKSHSAQDDKSVVTRGGMRMYGTPWHGEAMFASPNSAPLTRIFVLEHGHGNVVTRLSKSQAVAELFARSFVPFHRHEYVESALEFLQELAEAVPCYLYSFEPDLGAVEKILDFRD
jgi:hypothetical protein